MSAPYDNLSSAAILTVTAAIVNCCNQDQVHYTNVEQHNDDYLEELIRHNEQIEIDNDNDTLLQHCEYERKDRVDIASAILAVAMYLVYDKYYDKYKEVLDWRDEIGMRIKDCLEQDIDHYIGVVMANMNSAIADLMASPRVTVSYSQILARYCGYGNQAADAAAKLMNRLDHKNCPGCAECQQCADDLAGWATMNAISAADDRVRFDENRVPRRLDLISGAVDSAHSSTFNLPGFDYQALSNAAQISSSLATAYAGIANSALGSFGYYSGNFINSLS